MTPEKWNDERLDDLAQQVRTMGTLTGQVVTNAANIKGHEDDIRAIRESMRDAIKDTGRMLVAVGAECDKNSVRVEKKVDDLAKDFKERSKAQEWTLATKLTLFSALFGPLAAALIVVLTKGP